VSGFFVEADELNLPLPVIGLSIIEGIISSILAKVVFT
jgi:hypothetical protein